MLPYYNNDEERVRKMGEEQARMDANLTAAMSLFPQATTPRVSAAIFPVSFSEAVRKAKEEEEAREDVGVGEEVGTEVGRAWRRGYLPHLECLGLNGVKMEGDVVGALLRRAGWVAAAAEEEEEEEEEEEGGREKEEEEYIEKLGQLMEMALKATTQTGDETEEEGGREGGGEGQLLLRTLDLGNTNMCQEGARALASAFESWGCPSSFPPSLIFLEHTPASFREMVRDMWWAPPLRSLSLGGWVKEEEEGGKTENNKKKKEGVRGAKETLLYALLVSPACRALEVLRVDEQVALTKEEV